MHFVKHFLKNLNRPAPLTEFSDYDDYWLKRGALPSPILYRHKFIADQIEDGASVLDIGCGDGTFMRYLSELKPNCRIVGLDVSSQAIERVRSDGFTAYVYEGSTFPSSISGEQFDYTVLMEVIEHVHEAEELMKRGASVTRKMIFATLPNVGFLTHRLRLFLFGQFPVTSIHLHMKEHIRFWTTRDFKEWAHYLGLSVACVDAQVKETDPAFLKWLAKKWPGLFAPLVIYQIISAREADDTENYDG